MEKERKSLYIYECEIRKQRKQPSTLYLKRSAKRQRSIQKDYQMKALIRCINERHLNQKYARSSATSIIRFRNQELSCPGLFTCSVVKRFRSFWNAGPWTIQPWTVKNPGDDRTALTDVHGSVAVSLIILGYRFSMALPYDPIPCDGNPGGFQLWDRAVVKGPRSLAIVGSRLDSLPSSAELHLKRSFWTPSFLYTSLPFVNL